MNRFPSIAVATAVAVLCSARMAAAQPVAEPHNEPPRTATSDSLLVPPQEDGPVVVRASFEFHDINEINDEQQTFEFTGVLTLKWHDKRQTFDPAAVGVQEKVYQGAYQFNELSPSWFPQLVLVNSSGSYESRGVVLRAQPDVIGILTVVAYQVVMSQILPRIASITWMNGFLNISFLTMVGAVLINLWVGALDKQGRSDVADRIDRRCRWIFPLTYFLLILLGSGVAFLIA